MAGEDVPYVLRALDSAGLYTYQVFLIPEFDDDYPDKGVTLNEIKQGIQQLLIMCETKWPHFIAIYELATMKELKRVKVDPLKVLL